MTRTNKKRDGHGRARTGTVSPKDLLLPYQRRWVDDAARFKMGVFARQCGKSFCTAEEAVEDSLVDAGTKWVCLSAGERQALEWLEKAKEWAEAFRLAIEEYAEDRGGLAAPLLSRHAGFDERYRAFPIHLSYFASGTLRRLLETHGFEVTMSSTSGMGLEEIILRPEPEPETEESPASSASTPPPARPARPSTAVQAVKTAVKTCFHSLKLGEYLLAIATPRA